MSIYLTVTIDVEEDMPNWGIEDETTIRNLERIPVVQELFDKYGVRPTYLLNYPFASSADAVKSFREIGSKCEIGCHMHNWNTPPLEAGEDKKIEHPSNLPYERQFEKIKMVTDRLESEFGYRPVSYRAGKFGFKQLTGLEKCQCRKRRIQRNHIACSMLVWARLKQIAHKIGETIYRIKHGLLDDYLIQQLKKTDLGL